MKQGFLMAWSSLKLAYARSLLVLFSVSHLLLLCHPTHVFDISYIHLFRTLDAIRYVFVFFNNFMAFPSLFVSYECAASLFFVFRGYVVITFIRVLFIFLWYLIFVCYQVQSPELHSRNPKACARNQQGLGLIWSTLCTPGSLHILVTPLASTDSFWTGQLCCSQVG